MTQDFSSMFYDISLDMKNHLYYAHALWKALLKPTDHVIDATCGNGKDTLVLAQLVPKGHVYALDIQTQALEAAKCYVCSPNVTYLHRCHSILPFVSSLKLVVYNLGYLPGGNKNLTTQFTTTLISLQSALASIEIGGALSILCYPGHPAGRIEHEKVQSWLSELPPSHFSLQTYKKNLEKAPVLYFVIKLKF